MRFIWGSALLLLCALATDLYLENQKLKDLSVKQFQQLERAATEFKKRTEELEKRAIQLDQALLGVDKDWSDSSLPDSVRSLLETMSCESARDLPSTNSPTKNVQCH